MCDSPCMGCAWRRPAYMWRQQAMIEQAVSTACDLCCYLLPQCEVLHTSPRAFWSPQSGAVARIQWCTKSQRFVSKSLLFWLILLAFWFDIVHAVAELDRASHCIATNGEYFEVSTAGVAKPALWGAYLKLKAANINNGLHVGTHFCSHNAGSPWANKRKRRTDDSQHNSNWDYPFDYIHSSTAARNSTLYLA